MKNLSLILILFACTFIATAQSVQYQVLEDHPDKAYTKFVAPEIGFEYNSENISVSLGANARYGITDLLTLEGAIKYDVFQLNGSGAAYHVETGAFLPLTGSIKNKEVPIVLSYDPYAGTTYKNGQKYNIEETKYIKVPSGQYKRQLGVRGGIYNRSTGIENLTETISTNIFLMGVYLGGQLTNQAYVKTLVNNDVERIGAGFGRIYGDIILFPVSNLGDETLTDLPKKDGAFGWRVGYQWYVSPHDGDYRFLGSSVFSAEIGSRPLSGFMFNVTWGFALLNKR